MKRFIFILVLVFGLIGCQDPTSEGFEPDGDRCENDTVFGDCESLDEDSETEETDEETDSETDTVSDTGEELDTETETISETDSETEEPDTDCECEEGECCDGCHILNEHNKCEDIPYDSEYQCSGQCEGTVEVQHSFRYCDGVNPTCGTDNIKKEEWTEHTECSGDTPYCDVSATGQFQCLSECPECECEKGACCNNCKIVPENTICDNMDVGGLELETRCVGGTKVSEETWCGADLEVRHEWFVCNGTSNICPFNFKQTGFTDWEVYYEKCGSDNAHSRNACSSIHVEHEHGYTDSTPGIPTWEYQCFYVEACI